MAQKFRAYCYTLNNYSEEEYNYLLDIDCRYHIIGKEIGESGTPHLQGFIYFKNPRGFNPVKKIMKRWHIEICKGSTEQNIDYCSKGKDFVEKGDKPCQGKRQDICLVKELVKSGMNMKGIVETVDSYQAIRHAEVLKKYLDKPRDFKTYVHWFYGESGSGKSRAAYNMYPDAYTCMSTGKWWEGYDGEECTIIDDIREDFYKFHELLKLLDRYPFRVETKGGSRQFVSKVLIITSPYHPKDLYKSNCEEDVYQLLRRVDNISEFKRSG